MITEKNYYREIVDKLLPYAKEIIKSDVLRLAPGSYSARDIHKHLNRIQKDYQFYLPKWASSYDALSHRVSIQHEYGTESFPIINVFYLLMKYQKLAGLSSQ